MAALELYCWKCGESLADTLLPLSRVAKCKSCKADLHACRICQFYDPSVSKSCREPIAEEVQDKTRSNFCGYLQPSPKAFVAKDSSKDKATKSELDTLFGLASDATDDAGKSAADASQQKLDQIFGLDDKNKK